MVTFLNVAHVVLRSMFRYVVLSCVREAGEGGQG
jgi:hypothetical protein